MPALTLASYGTQVVHKWYTLNNQQPVYGVYIMQGYFFMLTLRPGNALIKQVETGKD